MTEILFYHLQRRTLDQVLPGLLQTCRERDWRVVLQAGSEERLAALDAHLWSYSEESFLPHGTASDGHAADQPVFLTCGSDNPNGATVRFLVDRAKPSDLTAYERVVFLFDGHDDDAVADARGHWRAIRDSGHELTYWQENEGGGWEKKA